jgi:hypothetical protein
LPFSGNGGNRLKRQQRRAFIRDMKQRVRRRKAMGISKVLADGVARNLREFGYPDVTNEMVLEELDRAPEDRTIIGMMACGMLEDNGLAADGTRLPDD